MPCLSYTVCMMARHWIAYYCAYCIPGTWYIVCDNVVSLWRCFVTTVLYISRESARTLVVLDVDGKNKRFNMKNTPTSGHTKKDTTLIVHFVIDQL